MIEQRPVIDVRRLVGRIGDSLDRVFDVFRRHLPEAVRETDIVAQHEMDMGVIQLLDGLRGHRLPSPLVACIAQDEAGENAAADIGIRFGNAETRIKHLQVAVRSDLERAARLTLRETCLRPDQCR